MLMFVAFVLIPQCLDDVYESISTECLPIRTGAGARRTILRIPSTRGASRSEGFSILTRTLRRLDTSTTWRFSKDFLIQLLSEFCEYLMCRVIRTLTGNWPPGRTFLVSIPAGKISLYNF